MGSPTEQRIRARACELRELAGQPPGREDEFWCQAGKDIGETTGSKISRTSRRQRCCWGRKRHPVRSQTSSLRALHQDNVVG